MYVLISCCCVCRKPHLYTHTNTHQHTNINTHQHTHTHTQVALVYYTGSMALGSFLQALLGMLQYLFGFLHARTQRAQRANRVVACLAKGVMALLCVLRTILSWISRWGGVGGWRGWTDRWWVCQGRCLLVNPQYSPGPHIPCACFPYIFTQECICYGG